MSEANFF
jgi:hypothetical protein